MGEQTATQGLTLQKAFDNLCRELDSARRALRDMVEAAAGEEEVTAAARSLIAIVEDATLAAQRGQRAARLPADIDSIRRALPRCQRQVSVLVRDFRAGLGSAARLEEFRRAERHALVFAAGRLAAPIFAAQFALGLCWQSAAQYAALNPGGVLPYFPRSGSG